MPPVAEAALPWSPKRGRQIIREHSARWRIMTLCFCCAPCKPEGWREESGRALRPNGGRRSPCVTGHDVGSQRPVDEANSTLADSSPARVLFCSRVIASSPSLGDAVR